MNETMLTMSGNLTADPELRFTAGGVAVANFTIASTKRIYNKTSNTWDDAEPLFMRCTAWRQMAENIAESMHKGARVVVTGELQQRSYETKEGEKRTVVELQAEDVSASVKYAHVAITRNPPTAGTPAGSGPAGGNVTTDAVSAPESPMVPPTDIFGTEPPF